MKKSKILALALSIILCAAHLGSCAKKNETNIGDGTDNADSKTEYTLSMGIEVVSGARQKGRASVSSTVAAVICDKDMRIVDCVVDCAENVMDITNGTVTAGATYLTKNEKGDEYKMESASGIGREWYEQAKYFADHVKGMDKSEVESLSLSDDGKAEDKDLSAGCTISVSDMKKALLKALGNDENLKTAFKADEAPNVRLAVITDDSASKSATQDSNGMAAMYSVFCAVAENNGRIYGAVIDDSEPKFVFDSTGMPDDMDFKGTKLELGSDYGMKAVSGIGSEWFEESGFLCNYIKGMSADEVAAIPLENNGKTSEPDLAAGCTVSVDKYIKAVIKAMKG